jgi:hypothetical protein
MLHVLAIESFKSFSFEYFNDEFYFPRTPMMTLGTALAM